MRDKKMRDKKIEGPGIDHVQGLGDAGYETIMLYGMIHRIEVMPAADDESLLIVASSMGGNVSCLLEQEHIDALHEFLAPYTSAERAKT